MFRLVSLLTVVCSPIFAWDAAGKVHVQVLVSEQGKPAARQVAFSSAVKPGPGKEISVRTWSDGPCRVSVAAFGRDGRLLFPPAITELTGSEIRELPAGHRWRWENGDMGEIDIVVLPPESQDLRDYNDLLGKMSREGLSADVKKMQEGALRRWVDQRLKTETSEADYAVKPQPTAVGGMVRGEEAQDAQQVTVNPTKAKIVRLRIPQ
jgi:hypothetical protein